MKKTTRQKRRALPLPDRTLVRAGRETEEGVPLLLWRVEIPALDAASGKTDAASFYTELAARTEAYLTGRFSALLREKYRAADPVRRRFTFRPAVYSHAVRRMTENGVLSIEREVTLSRAGRVLFSRVFCERWEPADGSFLPSPKKRGKSVGLPEKARKKRAKKVDGSGNGML